MTNPKLAKTVSGSVTVAVCAGVEESDALIWTLKAPLLVGAPLMMPLLPDARPEGRPATCQVIGGKPPNEDNVFR